MDPTRKHNSSDSPLTVRNTYQKEPYRCIEDGGTNLVVFVLHSHTKKTFPIPFFYENFEKGLSYCFLQEPSLDAEAPSAPISIFFDFKPQPFQSFHHQHPCYPNISITSITNQNMSTKGSTPEIVSRFKWALPKQRQHPPPPSVNRALWGTLFSDRIEQLCRNTVLMVISVPNHPGKHFDPPTIKEIVHLVWGT